MQFQEKGLRWVKAAVDDGTISEATLRRVAAFVRERDRNDEKPLLEYALGKLKPHGHQPPQLNETRKLKITKRTNAVGCLRVPLHHLPTKGRGDMDVTFKADRIVIQ